MGRSPAAGDAARGVARHPLALRSAYAAVRSSCGCWGLGFRRSGGLPSSGNLLTSSHDSHMHHCKLAACPDGSSQLDSSFGPATAAGPTAPSVGGRRRAGVQHQPRRRIHYRRLHMVHPAGKPEFVGLAHLPCSMSVSGRMPECRSASSLAGAWLPAAPPVDLPCA